MITTPDLKQMRLVSWFGANTANAEMPAKLLSGCTWVYIPFAGSLCEIPHFHGSVQLMVSDLHHNLITLAKIVKDEVQCAELAKRLASKLFHPKTLRDAQEVLQTAQTVSKCNGLFASQAAMAPATAMEIAEAFFVCAWMGRSALAGTKGECKGGLAVRYDAGGGDSVTRYDSAVASLLAWHQHARKCSFTEENAFDVIDRLNKKVTDKKFKPKEPGNRIGGYFDPPWADDGECYLHAFSEKDQRQLARALTLLPHVKCVMRFGDHPLVRELYPESIWTWHGKTGRDQHSKDKAEVFLVKKGGWEP